VKQPTRCGSPNPYWTDPVTHCTRPHGHDGQHGYAGVFWVDEPEQPRVEQRIVINGTPGVQIDVVGTEITYTIGAEKSARDGQRPNFDRFAPRGPTRDDFLDARTRYMSSLGAVTSAATDVALRRAFEAGWYEHQRQTGGGVV
jgi:hypothetical protein